jgi:hypothetical protein
MDGGIARLICVRRLQQRAISIYAAQSLRRADPRRLNDYPTQLS